MRFRTTLRLFLAVCILAGAIWFFERRSESEAKKRELEYSLFDSEAKDVSDFAFEHGNFRVVCSKEDGVWLIKSPLVARANVGEIERMLNLFVSIPKEEIIGPAQRRSRGLTLKDYGLLDPRARVTLGTRLGSRDVIMGYDAPLGDLMYVMYAGGKDVIAVHKSLRGVLPSNIEKLRDKHLLHGDAGMTSRLEIQRPGSFIQLAQVDGEWLIRQPISARADSGLVSRLLDDLYGLKATAFIWDPVIRPQSGLDDTVEIEGDATVANQTYHLTDDDASARVTVWVNGDEVGKELILGTASRESDKRIYAKLRDKDAIYTVDKVILDAVSVAMDDVRDKALYSYKPDVLLEVAFEKGDKKLILKRERNLSWMVVDPVKWPADNAVVKQMIQHIVLLRAESYVAVGATNLLEYGLEPCSYSITVSDKPAGDTPKSKLLIGKLSEDGQSVYGMFADSGEVMLLPSDMLESISLNPVDPLVYKDRTMLTISPESVTRLTLQKNGKEQSVILDDKGTWSVATGSSTNGMVNIEQSILAAALKSVLIYSSNLRAIRIEEHNPEDLEKYGLDKPSAVLTLGLASGEGIQKSLMIGDESGTDGRYVMVQGQDVVFVLATGVVNQLMQDLIKLSVKPESNEEKQ